MLKKILFIILSFSFACENMKTSFKADEQYKEETVSEEVNKAISSENGFIGYHSKLDTYLLAGYSFVSYSKDLALMVEKNLNNNYDINMYQNSNGKWVKTNQIISSYPEPVLIKKAKDSNRYLVVRLNNATTIDLYDLEKSHIEIFNVGSVYINQVSISNDGKRIFYRENNNFDKLHMINEVSENTWEDVEYGANIEISRIFKTKYSKNHVLIHYWDNSYTEHYDMFKIENDYSLTKVLDLTEDLLPASLNYLENVTLSDNVFSFRLEDSSGIEITTYVKDIYTGVWFKTENVDVALLSDPANLNSIFIDTFRDNLIVNYYDIDNQLIKNVFYTFDYSLNKWVLKQENTVENVYLVGEISFLNRVSFDVNENAVDIMIDIEDIGEGVHEFRGLSFQIIEEENNTDLTLLDTFDRNPHSLDVNFASLSGGRALMIDKEGEVYNLNLYKSINGTWVKQKTIYSNDNLIVIRKSKNSDTFISYLQNTDDNVINIFEPNLDRITPIEVGKIYTSSTNKPLISADGSRIVFCSFGAAQDALNIIQKEYDDTFSINELNLINLWRLQNIKFSGNYLVLRYLNTNFEKRFNLFKINDDFNLSEELLINEDNFAIQDSNIERDMVLSDTMFAYLSDTNNSFATITIYKNDGDYWSESGTVNVSGWFNLNRRLDYFNDSFIFNGLNITAGPYNKIKTVLFNFENGEWVEAKSNVFNVESGFTSPLFPSRLSYNLSEEALDACMLIRLENVAGVLKYENKCFSDRSFLK